MSSIYTINKFLQEKFGEKVIKLSLDGGFTCPNRDGTKGYGGCTFCSSTGSGEMTNKVFDIDKQIDLLSRKWPNVKKYIAYFQSYTNTYGPIDKLRNLYYEALNQENVVGIAIATRPDCIDENILNLLEEISKENFIWIELGLQTIHEKTAIEINRAYKLNEYENVINQLTKRNIPYVTHLILGLPGETKKDMKSSLEYVCNHKPFGIKLHMLNIVKGSKMAETHRHYSFFKSIEDYASFVVELLEIIPSDITIHRLNGDAPRNILITPLWSYQKRTILNTINKILKDKSSYQGKALQEK